MTMVKRIGWVFVGVLIGGITTGSVAARRMPQERPSPRLIMLPTVPLSQGGPGYFIKDTKTGACWLMIRSRDDMSGTMAPAPAASCEP